MLYVSDRSSGSAAMSEINITPLIDVMLTVLVIFMIAAPLLTQRIPLPFETGQSDKEKVEPVVLALSIRDNGGLVLQGETQTCAELELGLRAAAAGSAPVQLEILPSAHSSYEDLAQVLAMAQRHRITNLRVLQSGQPILGQGN